MPGSGLDWRGVHARRHARVLCQEVSERIILGGAWRFWSNRYTTRGVAVGRVERGIEVLSLTDQHPYLVLHRGELLRRHPLGSGQGLQCLITKGQLILFRCRTPRINGIPRQSDRFFASPSGVRDNPGHLITYPLRPRLFLRVRCANRRLDRRLLRRDALRHQTPGRSGDQSCVINQSCGPEL